MDEELYLPQKKSEPMKCIDYLEALATPILLIVGTAFMASPLSCDSDSNLYSRSYALPSAIYVSKQTAKREVVPAVQSAYSSESPNFDYKIVPSFDYDCAGARNYFSSDASLDALVLKK